MESEFSLFNLVKEVIETSPEEIQQKVQSEYRERAKTATYKPDLMGIVMRYDCIHQCDHCFFWSSPKTKVVLPQEVISRAIDFAVKEGMSRFYLSGGEPMLDPEQVFSTVREATNKGLEVHLQSSYLGKSIQEISTNADRLREAGLQQLDISLSLYHEATMPKDIPFNHREYVATIADEMTRRGILIHIKNIWDSNNGESESVAHSNSFAKLLLQKGAVFLGEPYGPEYKVFGMNASEVRIIDPSIISVGKARTKSLPSQIPFDKEEALYHCPIFTQSHHDGGMLTIYPDGNVARCCSAERGANFGFGNVLRDSFETIMEKIRSSKYVHPNMSHLLREGHAMLREEFPHLLPVHGGAQACEICSPIVARKKLRRRLAERVGNPYLFGEQGEHT